ncbi:MAG: hypothetical protein ACR2NU_09310 [Aeoliella sp.]
MSTATERTPLPAAAGPRYRLEVNSFDRVSSLLVALLFLFGTVVAVLVIIFLFRKFSPEEKPSILVPISKPRGEPLKGLEDEIEPPGLEDAPEDMPPQLQETLEELNDAITNKTAMLANESFIADTVAGRGAGPGSKHYDGSGGQGGNAPEHELRFEPKSDADYAALIDFFGGELGVLDLRENKIHYASDLNQAQPKIRVGNPADERRFNFRSIGPPLLPIEIKLARKAKIMKAGAMILVFYPDEVAQDIYAKEQARAREFGKESLEEIDRTVFRAEKKGREYEFSVEKQTYF